MTDKPATEVTKKSSRKPGKVHVIAERCKGCCFCIQFCPREVLEVSEESNQYGHHPPAAREGAVCSQCGMCTLICPAFAIYVTDPDDDEEAGEDVPGTT